MSETTKVVAKKRDRAGKGGARSSRREGLIPAVIYGDKQPPVMIAVEPKPRPLSSAGAGSLKNMIASSKAEAPPSAFVLYID